VAAADPLPVPAPGDAAVILRVGCPMWAHRSWPGRFLPAGLGRGEQLAAYATWCNAVEGNTTFYGVPKASTVASWAAAAPEDFRFAFKLPRTITHERRLRGCGAELSSFLAVLEPLGARAGALSVQLPASFGPDDLEVLDRFLAEASRAHRWAVEVRHPAFSEGAARQRLERVLSRRRAEWTSFDTTTLFSAAPTSEAERDGWAKKPRLPRRTTALGDRPVVRYVGRDDTAETVAGWQPWVPIVARWLAEGRHPTFFVHTPDNDDGPELARAFHDQVRALAPGLAALPDPIAAHPTTLF
jgi:uncharacterized protein YecE (DUF72 family)